MEILEGIASFNGKLEEFRESIKQDDYQDILNVIKGGPILPPSERSSKLDNKEKKKEDDEEKNENENDVNNDISVGKLNDNNLTIVIIVFVLLAFLDLNTTGALTLNFITRFCCAGIEVIYFTYSIELYPTPVRSLAFGINETFGNAGSIGAPYLLEFLISWQFLILFAVICAINAIVLIFLPETVGKPMVESIPEIDEINNNKNKKKKKKKRIKKKLKKKIM